MCRACWGVSLYGTIYADKREYNEPGKSATPYLKTPADSAEEEQRRLRYDRLRWNPWEEIRRHQQQLDANARDNQVVRNLLPDFGSKTT